MAANKVGNFTSLATATVQLGSQFANECGPVTAPIYCSSTFRAGNEAGFDYTRSGNPNFTNLEQVLAALERAQFCTAFSSGVAAMTAVASSLQTGDLVLLEENVYGCTYRLFERVFAKFGVATRYLDFTDTSSIAAIHSLKPRLVWLESPTNPLLKIIDIEKVARATQNIGATLLVDNTFASSYLQQPLALGADLSLLSTTKYINGHSDALGGAVCTNSGEWQEKLSFAQKALGLNPSPFDAWLTTRGVRTLIPRMQVHSQNALVVAEFLEQHPLVDCVYYPFLRSNPQRELAKSQLRSGSGIVSAKFLLCSEQIREFLGRLRLFTLAESLGGVESLVCHSATMSHASVPKQIREAAGVTENLLRFSVGIESADDLICDIEQALQGFAPAAVNY